MRSCPNCSTKLALSETECPACADDNFLLNDAGPSRSTILHHDLPMDGLAIIREIVTPSVRPEPYGVHSPPAATPYQADQNCPSQAARGAQQRLSPRIEVYVETQAVRHKIAVRKAPRREPAPDIQIKSAPDAVYKQIRDIVRQQQQERNARRLVATLCAIGALVLLCASAAIVSHARNGHYSNHDRADISRGQNGADFSGLERGGLGS